MMHYWECLRCTRQWTSCCFDGSWLSFEEKLQRRKQSWSWLCSGCFVKLEKGEFGVDLQGVYGLAFKLRDRSNDWENERLRNMSKANDYDYKKLRADQEADGKPVEELYRVVNAIEDTYKDMIKEFKTPARKELDEYQKKEGMVFFGPQPRPEGFVGD